MAQQIALLVHYNAAKARESSAQRAFVCHYSSHILIHEKDTASHLLNMQPLVIEQQPNTHVQAPLNYHDVAQKILADTAGATPCAVVVECPHREIGGKCTPYADLERISQLCRDAGVALHMDGARLWEALAHYTTDTTASGSAVTARDLCGLFDSIYVSCYKGLGGLTGALLMGNAQFIAEARIWLRRFGGNVFTLLPYVVSSYSCFRNYVAWNSASPDHGTVAVSADPNALPVPYSMAARRRRMQHIVALLSATPALQGRVRFDPPVPEVCLVHVYIAARVDAAKVAHERSKAQSGVACFSWVRPAPVITGEAAPRFAEECYFEFNMVSSIISDCRTRLSWKLGAAGVFYRCLITNQCIRVRCNA